MFSLVSVDKVLRKSKTFNPHKALQSVDALVKVL